jgi:hypothetical protein
MKLAEHRAGEPALLDTFAGMVPCVVVAVDTTGRYGTEVVVRLTSNHGAYRKGETVVQRDHWVVPRGSHYYRDGIGRIRHDYVWVQS